MGDLYEVVLAIDLRPDVPDAELAELRWHVNGGERPADLPIGSGNYLATYPLGDPEDPDCEWETPDPDPAFADRGFSRAIGGALVADLVERKHPRGWALTVRQEMHPDEFYLLRTLLTWLITVSSNPRLDYFAGYLRFCESTEITPLIVEDGRLRVPEEIESHTPYWQ
ncbi:hypothetical protein [Actinomadura fibrosa]|uniref:Uncharacterized protein n=1 Tax=Actinomadura fibrosa TaxID=111802 RepID=A0ABW2Y101_9ACTN|nr:hypothetical protein [Actinomadura fibrosa]